MKKITFIIIITGLFFISCSSLDRMGSINPQEPHLIMEFSFDTTSYPSFFGKAYPQMAVWVSHKKSNYKKTIYVTESGAKDDWYGADKRPSSIPVWYGIKSIEKTIRIDSVTGATPSGKTFTVSWNIPENLRNKKIDVYIEANVSFDFNKSYPKLAKKTDSGYSDVNGQPSLIWKAALKAGGNDRGITPKVIGHGHVLGKDNKINSDLSKITTAKDLFYYIKLKYRKSSKIQ